MNEDWLEPQPIEEVICGDSFEFLSSMPSSSVDLVVTDPPYLIETKGGGMYLQDDKRYVKELDPMKNGFDERILDELCRVMKKINVYFFCSQKQILPLLKYFVERKKCNWNLLCWHKSNPVPACGNKYLTDTEYILFFREKGVKVHGEYETKFTYYVTPLNTKDKKLYNHPTVKPLEIVKNLIINSSTEGQLVLDPFAGSGTTLVAAKELQRDYLGIEREPQYCDVAEARLAEVVV